MRRRFESCRGHVQHAHGPVGLLSWCFRFELRSRCVSVRRGVCDEPGNLASQAVCAAGRSGGGLLLVRASAPVCLDSGADQLAAALWPLSVDGLVVLASLGLLKPGSNPGPARPQVGVVCVHCRRGDLAGGQHRRRARAWLPACDRRGLAPYRATSGSRAAGAARQNRARRHYRYAERAGRSRGPQAQRGAGQVGPVRATPRGQLRLPQTSTTGRGVPNSSASAWAVRFLDKNSPDIEVKDDRGDPRAVPHRRPHALRRRATGGCPAAAATRDELVFGHSHGDRGQVEHLPALHAHFRRVRQVSAAAGTRARLVPLPFVRVVDQRQPHPGCPGCPPSLRRPGELLVGRRTGRSRTWRHDRTNLIMSSTPRSAPCSHSVIAPPPTG